jgi:hypothetical protein
LLFAPDGLAPLPRVAAALLLENVRFIVCRCCSNGTWLTDEVVVRETNRAFSFVRGKPCALAARFEN